MKLLILLPSISRGGAEEYALTIASAAVKQGMDVHAGFPQRAETETLIRDFSVNRVRYHPLKIGITRERGGLVNLYNIIIHLVRTLVLLCNLKPDVVLLVLPSIQYGLGAMTGCVLKGVSTIVVFQYVQDKYFFSRQRMCAYRWIMSRNQKWVAVSEDNRRLLLESFKMASENISVIPNGVNQDVTSLSEEKKIVLRKQLCVDLGINEKCKILITVAGLRQQKGFEYLIQTIPHVLKEFPDVRWVWAGKGEERDRLVKHVNEYGVERVVHFLGWRNDVSDLLNASDIFIFPTLFEGQPFALLEAMAAGLPLVTTNASGVPEVVRHMKHGIVCRKADSAELLEAIRYALRNPEEMRLMAMNAKLRILDFSEEKMVEKTIELIYSQASSKIKH